MGRRKIQIAPIVDDRNRNVTFGKRRNGLFKKAFELGVLCQVDVAVLVWSHTGKLHCYSSQGVMHKMIDRYQNQAVDDTEITGPNAYGHTEGGAANGAQPTANPVKLSTTKSGNKKRRRSSDDSDDDDDDDGEDDTEEAGLSVKVEKPRSEGKAKGNGNQTNGGAEVARQDSQDAFPNGNMANQQMLPNNAYGAPYFSGYPNLSGYQQYTAQQQALQNSFGLYGNMPAEAAQRAQAAALQAAAAYGYGPSFFMNNSNQGKYPAAYTPIQSPPPMPESAPTHLQGPNYGGGGGNGRGQPVRQESMNSEHGSTTSRPELHLSVPGLGPNESALRLDVGGNGRTDVNHAGHNSRGEPDEGRRSIFTASDSLLHLSENFGPSPSSLFPEIYRSMNHFGDSAAFQAAMSMNSAEEAAAGVFKWPTINNSNNNNSNQSFSNDTSGANSKVEETSMRSTQGNEDRGTPQMDEQNRRSPSHPQGEST